ncbi:MAG TPA: hypothetical protein VHM23_15670 [Actinomycetota bacterium]|jgi:hypothetical protein|nr:hypothetical protein [Actinomycetota bacterium]
MPRSRGLVATAVPIVTLAVGPAACGSDETGATESTGGDAAQPADSGAAPAQPAPTKAPAGQAAEPTDMANGRHPVVVKQVSVSGRTVTFDLVQYFSGDAATKAAAEDGEESPPPNDYYVRNVNPRLRTLPVTPDAHLTLTGVTLGSGGADGTEVDLATVQAMGRDHLFWTTVQGGRIVALEEQYVP